MQLDIGNCASGGGDPIAMLKKFPNRARSLHLKDYGGPPDSVIGEGKADWKTIFDLVETSQNTEWYVVEEGGDGRPGLRHLASAAWPRCARWGSSRDRPRRLCAFRALP